MTEPLVLVGAGKLTSRYAVALNHLKTPFRTFGQVQASVPTRNSSDRRPTPQPRTRRMKVRRVISPIGGPGTTWTNPDKYIKKK